jgi:hypothetical protein
VASSRNQYDRDYSWVEVITEVRNVAKQIRDRKILAVQKQAELYQIFLDEALAICQGVSLSVAAKSLLKKPGKILVWMMPQLKRFCWRLRNTKIIWWNIDRLFYQSYLLKRS